MNRDSGERLQPGRRLFVPEKTSGFVSWICKRLLTDASCPGGSMFPTRLGKGFLKLSCQHPEVGGYRPLLIDVRQNPRQRLFEFVFRAGIIIPLGHRVSRKKSKSDRIS
ncbi:hypothetical protein EYF88_10770 [Paracoccus sediminis]|uniref:Uncharacterized protein n=1 Tax=Paracoccus sediminis TaxID=1214787 RepID=A0ABY1YI19_9RHOB|nr:hypothetical protein [Paracoccus sediminis]TBN50094.1 hypothetical protein EYF88_10770 [Paracoccus sediminis]